MTRTPALLAVLTLTASGCLDIPEFSPPPSDGLGGEGEGEGGGGGEGEGEGGIEGEGEGGVEGEGEGRPPTLTPLLDLDFGDRPVSGVGLTRDGTAVATSIDFGRLGFFPLDGAADPESPTLELDTGGLGSAFAVSPTKDIAVTVSNGRELLAYALDEREPGDRLVGREAFDPPSIRPPLMFNGAGDHVVFMQGGDETVARVAGGVVRDWPTGGAPRGRDQRAGQVAVFAGEPDAEGDGEPIVVLDDPESGTLRIQPRNGFGGGSRTLNPNPDHSPTPCGTVTCLAGARRARRIAACCSDGTLRVVEPLQWTGMTQLSSGRDPDVDGPFEAAALSEDGRLAAAVQGTRLHVWDVETGGRQSLLIPAADGRYDRALVFGDGGLLAVSSTSWVAVWQGRPGG